MKSCTTENSKKKNGRKGQLEARVQDLEAILTLEKMDPFIQKHMKREMNPIELTVTAILQHKRELENIFLIIFFLSLAFLCLLS